VSTFALSRPSTSFMRPFSSDCFFSARSCARAAASSLESASFLLASEAALLRLSTGSARFVDVSLVSRILEIEVAKAAGSLRFFFVRACDEVMDVLSSNSSDSTSEASSGDGSAALRFWCSPSTSSSLSSSSSAGAALSAVFFSNSSKPSNDASSDSASSCDPKTLLWAFKIEAAARAQLRAEKKQSLEKGRIKDVLGLESANVDTGRVLEEERRLKKTAQRGVVRLFNAVRAAQVRAEEGMKQAQQEGVVGMRQREERMQEMSKEGFLELISRGGKAGAKA